MPAGRVGDWRGACARLGCQRHTPLTRHTQNPAPPLPVGLVRGLGHPGRQTHTSDRAAGADKVKNPACPPKFLRSPLRELHLPSGPAYHTQHTPHRPSCPHGLSDPPDLGTNTNAPKMQQDQPLAPCPPQPPVTLRPRKRETVSAWGCQPNVASRTSWGAGAAPGAEIKQPTRGGGGTAKQTRAPQNQNGGSSLFKH